MLDIGVNPAGLRPRRPGEGGAAWFMIAGSATHPAPDAPAPSTT